MSYRDNGYEKTFNFDELMSLSSAYIIHTIYC